MNKGTMPRSWYLQGYGLMLLFLSLIIVMLRFCPFWFIKWPGVIVQLWYIGEVLRTLNETGWWTNEGGR